MGIQFNGRLSQQVLAPVLKTGGTRKCMGIETAGLPPDATLHGAPSSPSSGYGPLRIQEIMFKLIAHPLKNGNPNKGYSVRIAVGLVSEKLS